MTEGIRTKKKGSEENSVFRTRVFWNK